MIKNLFLSLILLIIVNVSISVGPFCKLCHSIVSVIQHETPLQPTSKILEKIALIYCSKKHIESKKVCEGAINQMTQYIINSVWKHYTDPHSVCHKLLLCPKEYQKRDLREDIDRIIQQKPRNKQWEKPTKRNILKGIHISDLHPDLFYTVGASAKCSQPVCCRSNVTEKLNIYNEFKKIQNGQVRVTKDTTKDSPAGYWGSLSNCDLPLQTFDLFLKQIEKQDLDFIIWTGDNTAHDVWQQTQDYNLNFTVLLSEKISRHTNATIIPAMGNHESWPVNVYDYEGQRESMLKAGLAQAWRKWLDEKAYQMLRDKGYFSISFPKFNNLKVISINTQAGNDLNWYLLRNPTDPGHMLKWIQEQLKQSQNINQFVYIIGHIPPQSDLNDWSMRFNALVDRYSYIIRGQFYGHSHQDQIGFFPTFLDRQVLSNYQLTAPSITTYSDKNPSYRIMEIDYDTLQVINYHQYSLHLQKNPKRQDNPQFQLLYSFLEAYNLEDMTVQGGITELRNKMRDDPQTQIKYTNLKYGGLQKGHSGRDVYCSTMTSPQFFANCFGNDFKKSSFQKIAGNWKDLKHNTN